MSSNTLHEALQPKQPAPIAGGSTVPRTGGTQPNAQQSPKSSPPADQIPPTPAEAGQVGAIEEPEKSPGTPSNLSGVSHSPAERGTAPPSLDYWTHNVQASPLITTKHPDSPCLAVKVTEYGKGQCDVAAYKTDSIPRKRKRKTKERNTSREDMSQEDLLKSVARSKRGLKQKAFMLNPEYIITLTYKSNQKSVDQAYKDFDQFRRAMKKHYGEFHYVAVQERQKRGAIHFHILTRKRFNARVVRYLWQQATQEKANVDLKHIYGGRRGKVKVIRYISKYVTKQFGHTGEIGRKRYSVSTGIEKPRQIVFYFPLSTDNGYQLEKLVRLYAPIRNRFLIDNGDWYLLYLETY